MWSKLVCCESELFVHVIFNRLKVTFAHFPESNSYFLRQSFLHLLDLRQGLSIYSFKDANITGFLLPLFLVRCSLLLLILCNLQVERVASAWF